MKPRLWQKVTISLVALLIALAVSELVARAILPAPPNGVRQPQITYLYDPEIRYVMAPSQQGWIDDGFLRINSFGFRGRELTIPKPAGTFRVAVIGDSVTLGWGVADDETFSAQLEALLQHRFPDQGIEIVNLGVGGYDTRQEVTLLRRYVARLEPDLALVGFYSNDVPDSLDDNGGVPPSGTRIAASNPQSGQVLHMNPTPSSGWNQFVRRSRIAYTLGSFVNRVAKRGEWGTSRFSIELDILEGKQTPELNRAWSIVQGPLLRRTGSPSASWCCRARNKSLASIRMLNTRAASGRLQSRLGCSSSIRCRPWRANGGKTSCSSHTTGTILRPWDIVLLLRAFFEVFLIKNGCPAT